MLTLSLIVIGVLLLARLVSFQFQIDMAAYLSSASGSQSARDKFPERGRIFDRNGELLAANTTEYIIGASPIYITDKPKVAKLLAEALGEDEKRILNLLAADDQAQYVRLTEQPVNTDIAQRVAGLQLLGIVIDAEPKRIYPQNSLAAHVVGFVAWDGALRRGYVGVEGAYNDDLTGQSRVTEQSQIPFEVNPNDDPPPGHDIYLTIDRSIQYLAETELMDAINRYGATGGSILIMDPRNGEVLAMASYPTFDPNNYFEVKQERQRNPAVSDTYEPGSVFKIVTAAIALQSGKVNEDSTYYEDKAYRDVGGVRIYDWDRGAHGSQNFVNVLVRSWNLGTTWLSVDVLGKDAFYKGLRDFGVGSPTGIDLEGEAAGIMRMPGQIYWSDSDLASNSFGQALTVTPLQMLCFANAIANRGQMMQPHIRLKTMNGDQATEAIPAAARTPITPDIAQRITNIMIKVVSEGEGEKARVPGYTIAGKTGTAQIACATCAAGYDPELQEASFVGFLPADEPRVSVLIKLDKVGNYASQTAAPAFAQLVNRLVVIMNIPTDAQRQMLRAQGGNTALIARR
jgi:cell division protein FtsI/penicillin-binding protein 2